MEDVLSFSSDEYPYGSGWLTMLLKSIKTLDFGTHGCLFLNLLPIGLLFDKNKSKLQNITLDMYLARENPSSDENAHGVDIGRFDYRYAAYFSQAYASDHNSNIDNAKRLNE